MHESRLDPETENAWHAVCACEDLRRTGTVRTELLGRPIVVDEEGAFPSERRSAGSSVGPTGGGALRSIRRYGYVWVSFGEPATDLFEIGEYDAPGRRNVHAGTFGVASSAPRVVENFLDMGHFAFVHPGYLGEEPFTEIAEYEVTITEDEREIVASECKSFRSRRSEGDSRGVELVYTYRVMSPFCTLLTMPSEADRSLNDIVAVFVQPVEQERSRAHMLLSVLDSSNTDAAIRRFQQTIFGQDKPILENQYPKRLPLNPRAETPIRADKAAIAYRRWLSRKGVTFGVIPATA